MDLYESVFMFTGGASSNGEDPKLHKVLFVCVICIGVITTLLFLRWYFVERICCTQCHENIDAIISWTYHVPRQLKLRQIRRRSMPVQSRRQSPVSHQPIIVNPEVKKKISKKSVTQKKKKRFVFKKRKTGEPIIATPGLAAYTL